MELLKLYNIVGVYCWDLFWLQEVGYIADKLVKAERRIAACPWDTEAWSILIRDAQVIHYLVTAYVYMYWCAVRYRSIGIFSFNKNMLEILT